jgi:hypothetical protein
MFWEEIAITRASMAGVYVSVRGERRGELKNDGFVSDA